MKVNGTAVEEYSGCENVVLYLDLDRFKIINDTCGHLAGDELLRNVSNILMDNVRKHDLVARLGGDEFSILLKDCSLEQAKTIAGKLVNAIADFNFEWDDEVFKIGVSIGVASLSHLPKDIIDIIKAVDIACYAAKEAGRNCFRIYSSEGNIKEL